MAAALTVAPHTRPHRFPSLSGGCGERMRTRMSALYMKIHNRFNCAPHFPHSCKRTHTSGCFSISNTSEDPRRRACSLSGEVGKVGSAARVPCHEWTYTTDRSPLWWGIAGGRGGERSPPPLPEGQTPHQNPGHVHVRADHRHPGAFPQHGGCANFLTQYSEAVCSPENGAGDPAHQRHASPGVGPLRGIL